MVKSKSTVAVAQQAAVAERPASADELIAQWFAGISLEMKITLLLADALEVSDHPLNDWWRDLLAKYEDELLTQAAQGTLEGVNAAMAGVALTTQAWSRSF